ncbi:MAG: hypothetical protein WC810_27000 [Janthinobacterium sp.]|jgi:DNA-binding MarR family transcriptional regulator
MFKTIPNISEPVNSNQLYNALASLELSPTEIQTYLTAYRMGPTSITHLAQELGLQRPYVHIVINNLRTKGLIPPTIKTHQRAIIVESPKIILELLNRKREQLNQLSYDFASQLPQFLASYQQGGQKSQILFYEGKEKFFELYERILLEEGKETLYYGEAEMFLNLISEDRLKKWVAERVHKGVIIKTLMPDTPQARTIPTNQELLRQTKIITSEIGKSLPASFQVFGNNVIYWQPMAPLAIVIQDDYISKLMRLVFEQLWAQGLEI